MAKRIETLVVLRPGNQPVWRSALLSRLVLDFWIPEGRRIIVHKDVGELPAADAAFVHVDRTHVPPRFAERAAQFPASINARVNDISKRRVCTTLVHPDDDYAGPVIVKTDFNHRALPERRLGLVERDWDWVLPPDRYPVFDRKEDVPARVWDDRDLVVQRLHVERQGDFYVNRNWYFLGDRDVVTEFHRSDPVSKTDTEVKRLPLRYEVPDALRRRRAELGFDYGKFDFVMEDGEPVLLDANSTPHDIETRAEGTRKICQHLAAGLDFFAAR